MSEAITSLQHGQGAQRVEFAANGGDSALLLAQTYLNGPMQSFCQVVYLAAQVEGTVKRSGKSWAAGNGIQAATVTCHLSCEDTVEPYL